MPPAVTGDGAAVWLTARSASWVTVEVSVAVLLPAAGSGVEDVTLAVSTSEVAVVDGATAARRVTVASAPGARVPRLQLTVWPLLVQLPWLAVAETRVVPTGRVSLSVVADAVEGPRLVVVRV